LGHRRVLLQFKEGPLLLASEDVGLHLHYGTLLLKEPLLLKEHPERRLNCKNSLVPQSGFVHQVPLLLNEATRQALDFDEPVRDLPEAPPLLVASPQPLDFYGKVFLDDREEEAGIPSLVGVDLDCVFNKDAKSVSGTEP